MAKPVAALQDALARHKLRHTPTGFAFALAESVSHLHPAAWDALTARASVFLRRPYLEALEANAPSGWEPRRALVYRGKTPVAAVAAQTVAVDAARFAGGTRAPKALLGALKARLMVAGNLFSWGAHAAAFAPGEDPAALWPAVAEALLRLRKADALSRDADFTMIKDLPAGEDAGAEVLRRYSYRPLSTDPNMVLDLDPAWKTFDDYLAAMHSKYRKNALKVVRDVEAAGCAVEPLTDLDAHAGRLHALYLQVHDAAAVKPATVPPGYLPAVARALGADFRCTAVRRGPEILGWVTTLKDGEDAVGYYIGFDRGLREELPVYFRLLQAVVADAIALGARRLSLGRTALEPKAKLGAKPVPMRVWLRHSNPALNVAARSLLGLVPHHEAPERSPFKA